MWQLGYVWLGCVSLWRGPFRQVMEKNYQKGEIMVYKPKQQYKWNEGFSFKTDANTVGGMIEHLEKKHGSVTGEMLLEASRSELSQTHDLFEWDDAKAAENYRLHTARCAIGQLRVVVTMQNGEQKPIRAFVNVSENHAMYENITAALKDESKREVYLNKIRAELNAFIQRNKNIEELADMLINAGENLKEGRLSA